jgi:hypothetical protein
VRYAMIGGVSCPPGFRSLQKPPTILKARAIQTWLVFPSGALVRVTYKRANAFAGRRIEIKVNGTRHFFGPEDGDGIRALLAPL